MTVVSRDSRVVFGVSLTGPQIRGSIYLCEKSPSCKVPGSSGRSSTPVPVWSIFQLRFDMSPNSHRVSVVVRGSCLSIVHVPDLGHGLGQDSRRECTEVSKQILAPW